MRPHALPRNASTILLGVVYHSTASREDFSQMCILTSHCKTFFPNNKTKVRDYYFGGARSKGLATLRNVSKLQFFDKIGQAKSVGFRLYSAI